MFLALRDLRRAKVRFGLLMVAVGLLIFLTLFLQSLFGSLVDSFTGALRNQSGTVVVLGADARKNLSGSVITPNAAAAVTQVDGVGASGPLGVGAFTILPEGKADTSENLVDAFLFGYELGKPGAPTTLTNGRLPEGPNEAVATAGVSGFRVGDTVRLLAAESTPPIEVKIVGEASDLRYSVQTTLFVSYDTFTAARYASNPAAVGQPVFPAALAVTAGSDTTPEQLATRINANVRGVEAFTTKEAAAAQPGVASVNQSFSLLLVLTVIVVLMVMAFFFLILTVQKAPAFTLLRAAGASKGYLRRAILIEVCAVLVGGLVVGFVLLITGVAVVRTFFPATIDAGTAVSYGLFLALLGFIGSLFSLRRIGKLDPANAANAPTLGGLA
jgi:putative ABC transport system permease protein